MSDFTPRVVRRPGFDEVFGVIDLTARQVELIMGALATLNTDNAKVSDGYDMYSDLFDSVEQLNERSGIQIELNPYVIGTLSGPDPTVGLRALIQELKEGNAS